MQIDAFSEMLDALDDSIALAEDAIAASETAASKAAAPVEKVVITKVAASRYRTVAQELLNTGSFPGATLNDLSETLERGGDSAKLEILEKLAARSVFSMDSNEDSIGDLVEKPKERQTAPAGSTSRNAAWQTAMDEAGVAV